MINECEFLKQFVIATTTCTVAPITIAELVKDREAIEAVKSYDIYEVSFGYNGKRMYVKDNDKVSSNIYAYRLNKSWDLSTINFAGVEKHA